MYSYYVQYSDEAKKDRYSSTIKFTWYDRRQDKTGHARISLFTILGGSHFCSFWGAQEKDTSLGSVSGCRKMPEEAGTRSKIIHTPSETWL